MNNFLNQLVDRSLSESMAIQPRVPSLFEPIRSAHQPEWTDDAAFNAPPASVRVTFPSDAMNNPTNEAAPHRPFNRLPPSKRGISWQEDVHPMLENDEHPNLSASWPDRVLRHPLNVLAVLDPITESDSPLSPSPQPIPPGAVRAVTERGVSGRPSSTLRPVPSVSVEPLRSPKSPSTIQVSIGRVEVRAVMPSTPPARKEIPVVPKLSLEEYLKQRNGGGR